MRSLAAAIAAAALLPALAHAAEYEVRSDRSTLAFVYKQMGVPVEGRFKRFDARIRFDPDRLTTAGADIRVDLASIDTGFAEGDAEVAGKNWFDARAHPQANFVSTSVKPLGGNRYEAAGRMTIRGRTRDVAAPFTFSPQDGGAVFEGVFAIKRADYGIGQGAWADFGTVANEVQIKFRFRASVEK